MAFTTLIEDNWWLLKYFAAKSPKFVALFTFPLIAFWGYHTFSYDTHPVIRLIYILKRITAYGLYGILYS
jgi:hypothetical protein